MLSSSPSLKPPALPLPSLLACVLAAEVSLYVPGFDPQPITAVPDGVEDGQTTWLLAAGEASGDLDDSGLIGTATLVHGKNHASLTYVAPDGAFTMGYDCSLDPDNNIAVCTAGDGTTTATFTEAATPFPVQVADADVNPDGQVDENETPDLSQSPGGPSPSDEPSPGGALSVSSRVTVAVFAPAIIVAGWLAVV